jgi:AraC family transcriptional regulator, transcriptional activator FtrA
MAQSSRKRGPGLVAALAYDGLCAFEFGIAAEAFGLPRPKLGVPWYEFAVVAVEPGPLRTLGGMTVQANCGLERLTRARTIVLPGWRGIEAAAPPALLDALRKAHARGARFLSICSGAFVLAQAGLLDNRRATTHWAYARAFQQRFPRVRVEPDVLYVDEGNIITSAGSAAGIDACLHLIRRDFGVAVANRVARTLVMPPYREGGQAQYIEAPIPLAAAHSLSAVMDWARRRLHQPVSVAAIARRAAASERTLLRRFVQATGETPLTWLLRERLYRAQSLLESTNLSLDRVAEACGFRSVETFRAAFRRTTRTTPARYRKQFKASAAAAARPAHRLLSSATHT